MTQDLADFDAVIKQAKDLDNLQKMLRGKLQDTTKQRQAAQLKGVDMHERLAIQIKGKLGLRNENLVSLGIKPRRPRKPRASKTATKTTGSSALPEHASPVTAAPQPQPQK